ncbi:MAG: bifunctional glutamate N-acetyltransferase/amino-acid acetyltransferase ArgJ [Candidatus Omnitrophica bacterium]|nr:bifunctional glutamate N-acetyltransferase/amino-acid acetyltransferase ArgJ [Candidatus Omnitrophota bacterium]
MKIPEGFLISAVNCGIKRNKLDLGLIHCPDSAKALGFFTKSANVAYSVTYSKKNINRPIKAVLVNSGNANCFSHKNGLKDTKSIATTLAKDLKVKESGILFSSTGIIGKKLPKDKIKKAIPALIKKLGKNIKDFSQSICTTDSFQKRSHAVVGKASILGFAKGAGMIAPNMATMLAFILTDAKIPKSVLKKMVTSSVARSFNSISVDGCMSTNDTVLVLSSAKVTLSAAQLKIFAKEMDKVCLDLAKKIVRDGEGATKLVEIKLIGAKNNEQAKKGAEAIANSNLVKTAIYGENPNWGRIIAALGHAGIAVDGKARISGSSLAKKDVTLIVDLKKGKSSWTVYTCDLTYEYVKINAEYN